MFQRIGRDENFERIAADGQGTVYRARDTVLDRVVAVRVINRAVANDYGGPQPKFVPHSSGGRNTVLARLRGG